MRQSNIVIEDAKWMISQKPEIFEELANRNILITGGAGFLCAYLLDILYYYNQENQSKKINVLALDNFISGVPSRLQAFNGANGFEIQHHDVLKPLEDDRKFDYIIHGASIASPIFYRQYPIETIDVNVNGTWNMLRRAKDDQSKAVLYLSSSEIYGDPDPRCIPTEETYLGNVASMGPRACYDESKRMGETLAYNYYHQHQTPVKIVRPFNVYGPGQNLNDQRILPDLMAACLEKRDIVLFSDGSPTRSFIYVRDFIAGMLDIMINGEPAEAYNVGNDEEVTIKEVALLAKDVAKEQGIEINVTFKTSEDADYLKHNPNRRCPDLTKTKSAIEWAPEVMVREGLARTLKSYLDLK